VIKYIGSKRKLVEQIAGLVDGLPDVRSVCDLFSGTSRVGHALKRRGYRVHANDHNLYAATLARCYVQADRRRLLADVQRLLPELEALPGAPGYFTQTFCEASRYFKPKNGARVDAIRERIAALALEPELEAVLLVSLMEAADRVDSTCGLQMAYLKRWAPRADNDLTLRVPDLLDGPGSASQLDALECARSGAYDLVYVDPPYNQHKYLNNYHVWESLVRWDKPEVYGVACKRVDCREYTSDFNSKKRIGPALGELLDSIDARYLIVSFNDEGYLDEPALRELLQGRGALSVLSVDFKRYVGAQIGIYNPSGVKTGTVSHLRNRELLYVVDCTARGQLALPLERVLG
jgi:adenine-specific DNA-methyltransferase